MELLQNMVDYPLFKGISAEQIEKVLQCASAKRKIFCKGSYIFSEGDAASQVGILISGEVDIVKEDVMGNRALIGRVGIGETFSEHYAYTDDRTLKINALAMSECEVLLLDYNRIITPCKTTCESHAQLLINSVRILAERVVKVIQKMDYLSKRSLREKILEYLSYVSLSANGDKFTIPFSRQQLADYLYVDRSALSRELGKMKEEGIIDYNKNVFTLIKQNSL